MADNEPVFTCSECGRVRPIGECAATIDDDRLVCEGCLEEAEGPEDGYDRDREDEEEFEDPGGESALRRATPDNPRNLPCPTCGRENMLTLKDVRLGYQCDGCAREQEAGY